MSSLVLSSDHRGRRGQDEPDGGPESLVGRIDYKTMGTRAFRETVDAGKAKKKAVEKMSRTRGEELAADGGSANKRPRNTPGSMAARDIIVAADQMEGMEYIPRTAETREAYQLVLAAIHEALGGEQPQDIIRDATDFVIVTLKDDTLKDFDRKKEISTAIPGITTDKFTTLVNLGKKITDFGAEEEDANKDPDQEKREAQIDDDVGVAVVFEDEEEEDRLGDEEDENAAFEVREDSDDDDDITPGQVAEGGVDTSSNRAREAIKGEEDEEQEIVIGKDTHTASDSSKPRKNKDGDVIPPRDIDGFWLQRLLSTYYPDPHETTAKTQEGMIILSSDSNTRDVENSLMDLFDYDKFDLVRILLKNREKIVWCTRLARSDEATRLDVEVTMREKGVGWILKELASSAPAVLDVSNRLKTASNGDGMNVDTEPELASIPKANIAAGSLVQPRGTVDLESMIFSQGARLMSNKKCRLPEGSFKRSKKGYEEIHVPPPKSKEIKAGDLVPITDLPEWARPAFKGAQNLNRVQSKLYPVAFGEDDPILLCAPTGAGKVSLKSEAFLSTDVRTSDVTFW